jgi:hypothetical protein
MSATPGLFCSLEQRPAELGSVWTGSSGGRVAQHVEELVEQVLVEGDGAMVDAGAAGWPGKTLATRRYSR